MTQISSSPLPDVFPRGEVLARRYRIERFIDQGGMGAVYEALDLELDERIALKVIRSDFIDSADARARFRQEIQLARRVTHPNVCRIFDLAFHQNDQTEVMLLTMEYLEGETLARRIDREGPLEKADVVSIGSQIAAGLAAAHASDVVHRDLKSGNVMLVEKDSELRAVITDFGLARDESAGRDSRGEPLTARGMLIGTPDYMSPEQLVGGEVGPATDIYALGVVLYEMVTGRRPYHGDTPTATAMHKLRDDPPDLGSEVPDLDPALEKTVLRCLKREPESRFPSAAEASAALAERDQPRAASPKRNLRAAIATAAAVAVVLIGVIVLWPREQAYDLPSPAGGGKASVAVLGFANLAGDAETDWMSTALSETLITELGSDGHILTIPGETVARAKRELKLENVDSYGPETLGRIRKALAADYVVLGKYLVVTGDDGRTLRVDVRIQDTEAGATVSQFASTGSEQDLLALVLTLGGEVRDGLGLDQASTSTAQRARASLPSDPEAARLYSEGLVELRRFNARAARDLFEQAAEAEPDHPVIRSALAAAWAALGYDTKAEQEARRAFEVADTLDREHRLAVEARYREIAREWERAIEIYRLLWGIAPDNLEYGLRLANAQIGASRGEEALATVADLHSLPEPWNHDPRIELAEASAAESLSDYRRQHEAASRAAEAGAELGARLLVAEALLEECGAHRRLGEADAARESCSTARESFADADDKRGVAEAEHQLGVLMWQLGDLTAARELFEESLASYRLIGDLGGQGRSLNAVAAVFQRSGELTVAKERFETALAIGREIDDRVTIGKVLNNLANIDKELGELEEARRLYEESLTIKRESGNRSGVAYTLHNLGEVLLMLAQPEGARKRHREALEIFSDLGENFGITATLISLGLVDRATGDIAAAEQHFTRAANEARSADNPFLTAYSLFGLGEVALARAAFDEAERMHREALTLRTEIGSGVEIEQSRMALARIDLERGRPAVALPPLENSLQVFAANAARNDQTIALASIAEVHLATEDTKEAAAVASRARGLVDQTGNRLAALSIEVIAARADRSRAEASRRLAGIVEETRGAGLREIELRARIALAVANLGGTIPERMADLDQIAREARELGLQLVASKAETDRTDLSER